ncbi:hypothetical protein BB561_000032 [Smittium simulii]|uniref:Uncharacterized protein n=1 Tax=Smittium simulii TaxID=133385 RepID=A0A2T9YQG4_9FUNG|nr:hypothetical protein BB561_002445 [Smittium simulii]PVU98273.1 hypothetical protein BB561_000032 [Smittium simulii]
MLSYDISNILNNIISIQLSSSLYVKVIKLDIVIIAPYSPKKIKANENELYSVNAPLTNSDSDSTKSNGGLLVSASAVINIIINKEINCAEVRKHPIKEYLELPDQPANIIPTTPTEDIASILSNIDIDLFSINSYGSNIIIKTATTNIKPNPFFSILPPDSQPFSSFIDLSVSNIIIANKNNIDIAPTYTIK